MFGLALNANAVGALNVTTNNGPDDTSGENQTGEIADEYITAVHITVKELEAFGQLVIEFECSRDTEQHQKTEVHHRVHEASS